MSLKKWLLKRGFGSPGHCAKTACGLYIDWKQNVSADLTGFWNKMFVLMCPGLTISQIERLTQLCNGDLHLAILAVITHQHRDNIDAMKALISETIDVVIDVVEDKLDSELRSSRLIKSYGQERILLAGAFLAEALDIFQNAEVIDTTELPGYRKAILLENDPKFDFVYLTRNKIYLLSKIWDIENDWWLELAEYDFDGRLITCTTLDVNEICECESVQGFKVTESGKYASIILENETNFIIDVMDGKELEGHSAYDGEIFFNPRNDCLITDSKDYVMEFNLPSGDFECAYKGTAGAYSNSGEMIVFKYIQSSTVKSNWVIVHIASESEKVSLSTAYSDYSYLGSAIGDRFHYFIDSTMKKIIEVDLKSSVVRLIVPRPRDVRYNHVLLCPEERALLVWESENIDVYKISLATEIAVVDCAFNWDRSRQIVGYNDLKDIIFCTISESSSDNELKKLRLLVKENNTKDNEL